METNFKTQDLQNHHTLTHLSKVMSAANSVTPGTLIVEEVGFGLKQLAYRDETWDFVLFRCHPLDVSGRPERKQKMVDGFKAALIEAFGADDLTIELKGEDLTDRVIFRWNLQSHKVMD